MNSILLPKKMICRLYPYVDYEFMERWYDWPIRRERERVNKSSKISMKFI